MSRGADVLKANGDGSSNGHVKVKTEDDVTPKKAVNYKVDDSGEYEFAGPWGVFIVMVGFPIMMYYFWVGQVYYDSHFPWPKADESWEDFGKHFVQMAIEVCAFPFYPHHRVALFMQGPLNNHWPSIME